MKKSYLLLVLAIFGFGGISALHAQLDPSFLKNVKVFSSGDGRHLYTYEDVGGITFNPRVQGGAAIPFFKKSDIPTGYVSYSTGQGWIKKMYPNALCSEEYNNVESLIAAKFYLDFGFDKNGVWVPHAIGSAFTGGSSLSFPHQYPTSESNDPRSQRYYYCMEGGYEYVTGYVNYYPDALSCRECTSMCTNCPEKTETETDPRTRKTRPTTTVTHRYGSNNIYKNFKDNVLALAALAEAPAITGKESGIYAQINFNDRTPPWVMDCVDYTDSTGNANKRFPTIGEDSEKVTTGDWYNCNSIQITENRSDTCLAKMSLGKIDFVPTSGSNWTNEMTEQWDNDTGVESIGLSGDPKSGKLCATFMPNTNYGYMRYTVFTEDTATTHNNGEDTIAGGNLNPGCASIVEDTPAECYGLPNGGNLGENVTAAKPWPHSPDGGSSLSITNVNGESRIKNQEGLIRITDNDLPNILIKLTSTKDGKSIFFPPCMPAGELIVRNSPDYYGVNGTNQQDYNAFVGSSIPSECDYNAVKSSSNKPYFKLLKLEASEWANSSDKSLMSSMLGDDYALINKTFRLEDHEHSDTTTSGAQETTNNDGEAGMRNGTWKNCVAFIDSTISPNIRIQEDVEYKLEIWTDDSVKWSNVTSSFPTTSPEDNRVIAIPTGIKNGEVTLNIPNQYPPVVDKALSFNQNKSINEFKVVFREPTDKVTINSEEDLINNKFPYVTIKACDHSGNERTIKLYFSVLDENASIRTLQRKHDQH